MSACDPFRISTGNCIYQPDFYEDDEPVEKVKAAFEGGEKTTTAAPTATAILTAAADEAQIRGVTVGADDLTEPLVALLRGAADRTRRSDHAHLSPGDLADLYCYEMAVARAILGEVAS